MKEKEYLLKALNKSGYIIMVLRFDVNTGQSKMEYISPNAEPMGLNIRLLREGLKLISDYIYPEDRKSVFATLQKAIYAKVDSYVHNFRLVSDDGVIYNIRNEIFITKVDNDIYDAEFYMIPDEENIRNLSKTGAAYDIDMRSDFVPNENCDQVWKMYNLDSVNSFTKAFSDVSKLYSVVVDKDGNVVFSPVGPALNLGDFYDLFDMPNYKKYFQNIKKNILDNMTPTVYEREEGGFGKLSIVPLKRREQVLGFWILGSYTPEESEELCRICESQWIIAKEIENYINKAISFDLETAKSKGVGKRLKEELEKQNIINNALNAINTKKDQPVEKVIEDTLDEVGTHIHADGAFLCTLDSVSSRDYKLRSYWSKGNKESGNEMFEALSRKMFIIEECIKTREGTYVVNSDEMTDVERYNMVTLGIKALLVHAIYINQHYYGALFFVQYEKEHHWTDKDKKFTQSIAIVVQSMLESAEGDDNIRRVNKHLIESYNNFNAGIFVSDKNTGKVLFANDFMNNLLGYDFVGLDSRVVIGETRDSYSIFASNRIVSQDVKKTPSKWKSYVKALDEIMDIVEIEMEWLQGQAASLYIIRKANEF